MLYVKCLWRVKCVGDANLIKFISTPPGCQNGPLTFKLCATVVVEEKQFVYELVQYGIGSKWNRPEHGCSSSNASSSTSRCHSIGKSCEDRLRPPATACWHRLSLERGLTVWILWLTLWLNENRKQKLYNIIIQKAAVGGRGLPSLRKLLMWIIICSRSRKVISCT